MKTVVDMINETEESIKEMEEQLKNFSAKKLMIRRELDKIENEEECVHANIAMYHGILDDLTRRRDGEFQAVGLDEKPEEKKEEKIWPRPAKKVIMLDEHDNEVEVYGSHLKASKNLGVSEYKINQQMKLAKDEQIRKFGFVLIAG